MTTPKGLKGIVRNDADHGSAPAPVVQDEHTALARLARAPTWLSAAFVAEAGTTMARGLPPTNAPFVLLACVRDTHSATLAAVRAALDGADAPTRRALRRAIEAAEA